MSKVDPSPRSYPIRAVSRLTGVSTDTLRAWERRYRAVEPGRADRGRVYSDAEVARLKRLAILVKQGHAIGTIANLSDAKLDALLKEGDRLRDAGASAPAEAPLAAVTSALDRYDLAVIESTLNRHAAVLHPREFVFSVIVPLLRELGNRWEVGRLRPAQEHLVSATVRSVLGSLVRTIVRADATPKVVFATLAGERHELGLLCAALLAASAGYGVVYLGPDLPEDDIAHAASVTGARVVIISATINTPAARSAARQLARVLEDTELWIGGPEAPALLAAAGKRARHIEDLGQLIDMLSRYAR